MKLQEDLHIQIAWNSLLSKIWIYGVFEAQASSLFFVTDFMRRDLMVRLYPRA